MNNILSVMQAYIAMQFFLENYYNKTRSSDLGSLLGSMQLLDDGSTFDAAIWNEWLKSVNNKNKLNILDALSAMQKFLKIYCNYVDSLDIKNLLKIIDDPIVLQQWHDSVKKSLKMTVNKDN